MALASAGEPAMPLSGCRSLSFSTTNGYPGSLLGVFAYIRQIYLDADHYRLADAYIMPSHGEGFGFVFLEALACGIPAVGSKVDGGREALREGSLGRLVDPENAAELEDAILNAVREPKQVPEGIEYFSYENFERRCQRLMVRTSVLSG